MTTRSLRWSHQQVASYGALACLQAAGGCFTELHREGPMKDTLQIMVNLDERDVPLARDTLYSHLQAASKQKDLKAAHRLHSLIISNGFESDAFLIDHLIRLFTLCGKLLESQQVFHKISKANVYSWNALIQAHARLGEEDRALELLELMGQVGCAPDKCTFCCVLKACGCAMDLSHGMLIHDQIVCFGMESDLLVGSSLLDMYGKCYSLDSARKLFDLLPTHDVVSWCTIICALADHGDGLAAFDFFSRMQHEGMEPNQVVFLSLLKACITMGERWQGMMVHDAIIRCGFYKSDKAIGNTLVDMYAKCGCMDEAYQIFRTATCKDVVTWGAMMSGYVQHDNASCAFALFKEMHQVDIEPSQAIALCALKACSSLGAVKAGMLTNCCIVTDGFEADVSVGSALIDMYGRCGCLLEAQTVFELMKERDIAAWGTLIAGYAQCRLDYQAFELFAKLKDRSLSPDAGIFLSILKACTSSGSLERGRLVHGQVTKLGFFSEGLFRSSLVNMYAKLGSFKDAGSIFNDMENPDVASWGALIGGYAHYGHGALALELYFKMRRSIKPDKVVYLCALKACGSVGALIEGRFIHNQVLNSGLESEMAVGGSLVDMYSKCGSLDEALKVLKELPKESVVSWAPLIEGCVQQGKECLAFEFFVDMQKKGIKPDRTIYLFAARACASTQNSANGRSIHDHIVRSGCDELDTELRNVLVDMYAKWGHLDEAFKVFQRIRDPDVVSWGTLIAGYARRGDDRGAKLCFENMRIQGFKPDSIMGTSIFSACSRSGLLQEACSYFNAMEGDHGISPHLEHYNSMIDMFGRMGHLKEAEDMLQTMSSPPVVTGWTSLITSCRTYGNVGLGSRYFDISAQPQSAVQ